MPNVVGVLALCALWSANASASEVAVHPSHPCPATAWVTADNDIRLGSDNRPAGKQVPLPPAVRRRIHEVAGPLMRRMQLSPDWFTCGELYPRLFRIAVSSRLYLYVQDLYLGSGVEYFVLILFDPATNAVTRDPPRIAAKSTQDFGWKDKLLSQPLVSFAGLFGNHRQIVFEQRVHNGTVYNAVVYNYFDIGPGLALNRVLAIEQKVLGIGPQNGLIIRDLKNLTPTELRLDTFLQPADKPGERRELGYVILASPAPGAPFRVKERHASDPANNSILVTYAGPDTPGDDAFLRDGYTFNY
jgi:hypothetical protein